MFKKILKKILFGTFLIPIMAYYIIKTLIVICKDPENEKSSEEILLEILEKDKQKLQEYSKKRFGE